jgi:hypothetical protein
MLFKEIITIESYYHMKPFLSVRVQNAQLLIIKAGGADGVTCGL